MTAFDASFVLLVFSIRINQFRPLAHQGGERISYF